MDKKELINEIAKYACNACEMGGDFDGDCHDLIGEYTTCGICQGTANKIYDDFICKYIEELNKKDRQLQHLLRVCKILEIALNNALGLDYPPTLTRKPKRNMRRKKQNKIPKTNKFIKTCK